MHMQIRLVWNVWPTFKVCHSAYRSPEAGSDSRFASPFRLWAPETYKARELPAQIASFWGFRTLSQGTSSREPRYRPCTHLLSSWLLRPLWGHVATLARLKIMYILEINY